MLDATVVRNDAPHVENALLARSLHRHLRVVAGSSQAGSDASHGLSDFKSKAD